MNKTYLPSKPNIINSYVSSEKIKITIRVNNIDKNIKINLFCKSKYFTIYIFSMLNYIKSSKQLAFIRLKFL